jgi:hypothetical protein
MPSSSGSSPMASFPPPLLPPASSALPPSLAVHGEQQTSTMALDASPLQAWLQQGAVFSSAQERQGRPALLPHPHGATHLLPVLHSMGASSTFHGWRLENFPAPPTVPFFPTSQEQPLPFSLQRPVLFRPAGSPFSHGRTQLPVHGCSSSSPWPDASARPAAFAPLFPCSFSLTQQQPYLPCSAPLHFSPLLPVRRAHVLTAPLPAFSLSPATSSKDNPLPSLLSDVREVFDTMPARKVCCHSTIDARRVFVVFAQPQTSSSFTLVRPRRSLFDSADNIFL